MSSGKLLIALAVICLLALLMRRQKEETSDTCFVVRNGHEAVIYDSRAMEMRTVFFTPETREKVRIINPAPKQQYMEIYSWKTGVSYQLHSSGLLEYEDYTVTCRDLKGTMLAQTHLKIVRSDKTI